MSLPLWKQTHAVRFCCAAPTLVTKRRFSNVVNLSQVPIVNEPCGAHGAPRRFRSFHDIHALAPLLHCYEHAQQQFLASLNVSGSAQFSVTSCDTLVQRLRMIVAHQCHHLQHLVMLDLRQEPHMFVDGHAVGMYTLQHMFHEVDQDTWHTAVGLSSARGVQGVQVGCIRYMVWCMHTRQFPHYTSTYVCQHRNWSKVTMVNDC